ncbi:MAG: hypothetical protein A2879_05025 [Omnitrophica WOR_2 bacterium RIFCSPHIGHO2_01_FULL_49_10]|nr:MAG: hypothetical protein A2879_05025 [Omnitrophica WOR_2 bacterium RIFCSPHIGHO2_01_FULL_49_10]
MKNKMVVLTVLLAVFLGVGCASVQVKAPKDPIKVDITMRLDVYQHVVKDIDDIESIVSGKTGAKPKDGMKLNFLMANACADEGLSPDVEQAAMRRKDRRSELTSWESKGAVGENKFGLVEVKGGEAPADLVNSENSDRMIIYNALSQKNGAPLEDVQKIYAKRLQDDAPAGTPIEAMNASGSYEWKNK